MLCLEREHRCGSAGRAELAYSKFRIHQKVGNAPSVFFRYIKHVLHSRSLFYRDMRELTSAEVYSLGTLSLACLAVLYNAFKSNGEPLFASLAIGGLAFAFSYAVILWTGDAFVRRGYRGRDMSKKNPTEM